jgi:hypothetical protein
MLRLMQMPLARGRPFRTKAGLNSKLRVVCNEAAKPLVMLLTEGQ